MRSEFKSGEFSGRHQVQLNLLVQLLFLTDITGNADNYGLNGKSELAIVDFGVIFKLYEFLVSFEFLFDTDINPPNKLVVSFLSIL
jgi:hypothetical protein